MWDKILTIWKIKDLRNAFFFIFAVMIIFRITAHIPLPGVNVAALRNFFEANQALGLLNIFSGGTIANFSVVALGVAPYITSSIIFQLLVMIVPSLEALQKEGEAGQKKINQWTRIVTVPLAMIQSMALLTMLRQSQTQIVENTDAFYVVTLVATVTAGTIFLTWLGELISEKKIGNGLSLMIFAGILAGLPTQVSQLVISFDQSQIFTWIVYAVIAVLTVLGVVYVTEAQRNVPVQYARQMRGRGLLSGGIASHLPLRVNMAGVIPIIFAISLLIFPSVVAQFFLSARTVWVADVARWVLTVLQNQLVYGLMYFGLVFAFTFFYTAIIFHPDKIAENLQRQGGFIPGIRPGKPTAEYLQAVISRINLFGASFLGMIAVLPVMAQGSGGNQLLAVGGTSLLIVVAVVIESIKQVESQITMRQYDAY